MGLTRDTFQSRIGFILAAAGSAIGLGNIWGFPTQAANNGGGAFVFVYLIMTLLVGLPALYTEMYIGNRHQKNSVESLAEACSGFSSQFGRWAGLFGLLGSILLLSFYMIVAGWMLSHALAPLFTFIGMTDTAHWLLQSSFERDLLFTPFFILLTGLIIRQGVQKGIERWSSRLMPLLFILLICLIAYILQQPGAEEGLKVYLTPNFDKVQDPKLIISAMGQAFFSLSIGIGGMMVYGSYMPKDINIGRLALSVTALDTFIAFAAGLLIIPTLYVAQQLGQQVFVNGELMGGPGLIFSILPTLFESMGDIGQYVALTFFAFMSLAALTSTMSITEVPVAFLVEDKNLPRNQATTLVSLVVLAASLTLVFNFDTLFGAVITWVNTFQLPIMGLFYFLVIGWIWKRGNQLADHAYVDAKPALRLWANYLRYVCPILLSLVFISVVLAL